MAYSHVFLSITTYLYIAVFIVAIKHLELETSLFTYFCFRIRDQIFGAASQ